MIGHLANFITLLSEELSVDPHFLYTCWTHAWEKSTREKRDQNKCSSCDRSCRKVENLIKGKYYCSKCAPKALTAEKRELAGLCDHVSRNGEPCTAKKSVHNWCKRHQRKFV